MEIQIARRITLAHVGPDLTPLHLLPLHLVWEMPASAFYCLSCIDSRFLALYAANAVGRSTLVSFVVYPAGSLDFPAFG
jgi:hypothetical protein